MPEVIRLPVQTRPRGARQHAEHLIAAIDTRDPHIHQLASEVRRQAPLFRRAGGGVQAAPVPPGRAVWYSALDLLLQAYLTGEDGIFDALVAALDRAARASCPRGA